MQYQIKLLRKAGVRLSRDEILAKPWVIGQVVTWNGPGGKRLRAHGTNENLLLHPAPTLELFKVTLQEVAQETVTYLGMEQLATEGGVVAAVAQEWMLKHPSSHGFGISHDRENGILHDISLLK